MPSSDLLDHVYSALFCLRGGIPCVSFTIYSLFGILHIPWFWTGHTFSSWYVWHFPDRREGILAMYSQIMPLPATVPTQYCGYSWYNISCNAYLWAMYLFIMTCCASVSPCCFGVGFYLPYSLCSTYASFLLQCSLTTMPAMFSTIPSVHVYDKQCSAIVSNAFSMKEAHAYLQLQGGRSTTMTYSTNHVFSWWRKEVAAMWLTLPWEEEEFDLQQQTCVHGQNLEGTIVPALQTALPLLFPADAMPFHATFILHAVYVCLLTCHTFFYSLLPPSLGASFPHLLILPPCILQFLSSTIHFHAVLVSSSLISYQWLSRQWFLKAALILDGRRSVVKQRRAFGGSRHLLLQLSCLWKLILLSMSH